MRVRGCTRVRVCGRQVVASAFDMLISCARARVYARACVRGCSPLDTRYRPPTGAGHLPRWQGVAQLSRATWPPTCATRAAYIAPREPLRAPPLTNQLHRPRGNHDVAGGSHDQTIAVAGGSHDQTIAVAGGSHQRLGLN